ncbi:hypothetical protein CFC21_070221 [Triticum aestivum]|uniref:FBD domain-containing protein n=2 Tax=Triticum aestivum TaxID=4565 RepID=A0A9R1KRJ8_WHEAT|nr:hypothetical protein CFC21_070221 [Triticum aestivum]
MEAGGASTTTTRKRKAAALEGHPAPAAAAADPGMGEGDGGRSGEDGRDLDRLSSLPDAILGEIISLLPTQQGARTMILASRWRHLWRSAPLNFDCRHLACPWPGLPALMLRIISAHQGPGRRFSTPEVLYTINDIDAVEGCLLSPALARLQELKLNSWRGQRLPELVFRFSDTLVVFRIERCRLPDATVQRFHFPRLQRLEIVHSSTSECSLHSMIAGCPSLECLLISRCGGPRCLRINSLVLRSLTVRNYSLGGAPILEEIVIESAPCLERLFHLNQKQDLRVSVLFAPKLETLGCTNSTRLVFGSTDIQGSRTIKCLALSMPTLSLAMVIGLIRRFPCLEKLYIQRNTSRKNNNAWRHKYRDLLKSLDIILKIMVLNCYSGRKPDVDFVTFFALNAKQLESMTLVVQTDDEDFLAKQHHKLQLEKRASSGARFHFTTERRYEFGYKLSF